MTVAASAQQCIKIGRLALRPDDDTIILAIILRLRHSSTEMSARRRHSHRHLVVAKTIPAVDGKARTEQDHARPAATSSRSRIDWNLEITQSVGETADATYRWLLATASAKSSRRANMCFPTWPLAATPHHNTRWIAMIATELHRRV
ncbi:hypothetical protein A1D31_22775 [Bradyrhizobium liaoningense]|nr:hypothetical protein A1D31_22775 [Bradyrhizobium liaoningense]